jgi:hypothetical protein
MHAYFQSDLEGNVTKPDQDDVYPLELRLEVEDKTYVFRPPAPPGPPPQPPPGPPPVPPPIRYMEWKLRAVEPAPPTDPSPPPLALPQLVPGLEYTFVLKVPKAYEDRPVPLSAALSRLYAVVGYTVVDAP